MFIPAETKYIVEAYHNGEFIAQQYHKDFRKAIKSKEEVDATEDWHAEIVILK